MRKRALLLGILSGILLPFTYYSLQLLALSSKVSRLAPDVAAAMDRLTAGISGKAPLCETTGEPLASNQIPFLDFKALLNEYGRLSYFEETDEQASPAKLLIDKKMGPVDGIRKLRNSIGLFDSKLESWVHACDNGTTVSPETIRQLRTDEQELRAAAAAYRQDITEQKHNRSTALRLACIVGGMDIIFVLAILWTVKGILTQPTPRD